MHARTSVWVPALVAAALAAMHVLAPPQAAAVFGTPVVPGGEVELGLVTRQYERDIYDAEEDKLSNPDDTFGYSALEAFIGVYQEWVELDLLIGRAHNAQDRYPNRDYLTWNVAVGVRSRLYAAPSGKWDLVVGGQYRESIAFDRSVSETHKLERNYVAHGTFGRLLNVKEMPLRIYGGVIYSRHDFREYGESFNPVKGAARGETRRNVELLGGGSLDLWRGLEAAGEVEYRESLSFALSAGYRF